MKIEEFEECVDRYGEDVATWPLLQRERGKALLATSDAARGIISQAKLLRAAMTASKPTQTPAGLADRIVARAVATAPAAAPVPARRDVQFPGRSRLAAAVRPAVVLPLCFLVGIAAAWLPSSSQGRGMQLDVSVFLTGMVE